MGEWLELNGDAIYGTSASPFWPRKFEWGVCTGKGETIYLHLFNQTLTSISIPGIFSNVQSVSYLASGEEQIFKKEGNDLYIEFSPVKPDADVSVIAVRLSGKAETDTRPHQFESKEIHIPAWSLDIIESTAKMVFNGYDQVAHVTGWTDCNGYLSCDFVADAPGEYEVYLQYCSDNDASQSEITITVNSQMITFTTGNTGGWRGRNYETVMCGNIRIPNSGEQKLTITPVCGKFKNIAIKKILFKPL
jgi:alpha-L-fucosidase